ncbi:MAG: STAS domain-containing protein [Deltaproteobacteria bacterium]|jgi:anti-anti-sigma factor|nr:STAS domain-containing protein [Deltaproteobacteria bacterium]
MEYELPELTLEEIFTPAPKPEGDVTPERATAPGRPLIYETNGRKVVMGVFHGTISVANADNFSPALQEMITGNVEIIILALENVTKLSHSAVGILVDFAAGVLGRSKQLYLYKPTQHIEQRLQDLNVAGFFKILHSEDELICVLPTE